MKAATTPDSQLTAAWPGKSATQNSSTPDRRNKPICRARSDCSNPPWTARPRRPAGKRCSPPLCFPRPDTPAAPPGIRPTVHGVSRKLGKSMGDPADADASWESPLQRANGHKRAARRRFGDDNQRQIFNDQFSIEGPEILKRFFAKRSHPKKWNAPLAIAGL